MIIKQLENKEIYYGMHKSGKVIIKIENDEDPEPYLYPVWIYSPRLYEIFELC